MDIPNFNIPRQTGHYNVLENLVGKYFYNDAVFLGGSEILCYILKRILEIWEHSSFLIIEQKYFKGI